MPSPQPPRKHPKQARSRQLVADIVEAAARVFDEHGYEAANTNQVAAVAGVSVGSIYQYFPDKLALVTALHERHLEDVLGVIDAALGRATDRTLKQSIEEIVAELVHLHQQRPGLQRLLHDRFFALQYRKDQSAAAAELLVRMTQLMAAHGVTPSRPMLRAQIVSGIVEGLVHAAVLDPPVGAAPNELEAEIVKAALGYLERAARDVRAARDSNER